MGDTVALVVAGGEGRRFGGEVPKQYALLGGVPVLRRSLTAFADHPDVSRVRAVIHAGHRDLYDRATAGIGLNDPVIGGETRQQSVAAGLESLAAEAPTRVLIHDAARPMVGAAVISRVLVALDQTIGAIPALAVADTLKQGTDGRVGATVERGGLWRAQTPQGFRFDAILDAHRQARGLELTDDAAVAEHAGLTVAMVDGDEDNIKVTTADDLIRVGRGLGGGEARTGMGVDAHRFGAGGHVQLCGVAIAHDAGLEGHSDADVGLHAITDALLGSIAAGDIGDHFPPSDPQWRGADSEVFLRHAAELLARRGGRISSLDVTLICEQPRIGPHRDAMVRRIADILAIEPDRVSVKATTTDKLGFTGRAEGIAAQAVATVLIG